MVAVTNRDTATGHVTGPYVYNHFLSICFPQFEYQLLKVTPEHLDTGD